MDTNQMTMYETEDGKVRIEVFFEKENVWLTQKLIAKLFECSTDNVSLHLNNIYDECELDEKSTTEEFSVVQKEGARNEQDILQDKGKISHDVAIALAEKQYENFRAKQDRRFESDFDREAKKLLARKKKKK